MNVEKNKLHSDKNRSFIKDVFSSVSSKYDIMNDAMSLFMHRCWKRHFVNFLPILENFTYLDLSCGTGDIAKLVFKKYSEKIQKAYLVDPEKTMLDLAKNKILDSGKGILNINFIKSTAEEMQIKDEIDLITLSFGARNFSDLKLSLQNCHYALKNEGWFYCMEFAPCLTNQKADILYKYYLRKILPKVGKFIAKNEAAYAYLSESIENFLDPLQMLNLMQECSFRYTDCITLAFGGVNIYIGKK